MLISFFIDALDAVIQGSFSVSYCRRMLHSLYKDTSISSTSLGILKAGILIKDFEFIVTEDWIHLVSGGVQ